MEIDIDDARKIILSAQKLSGSTKASTLDIIQNLGHVQIDTISIVQRAHHHIIWARNPDYKEQELDDLLASRHIFEYWSHAASYLPIESYRYCLPRMQLYQSGKRHWFKVDQKVKKYVLDTIKAEGPKKARDFKSVKKNTGWFDWTPSKRALELLFMEGTLMATRREGFHKVYDLKENVLPPKLDVSCPSDREYAEFLIFSQLKSLGLAQADELAYQRGQNAKTLVKKVLAELVEEKRLSTVTIKNHKGPYYLEKSTEIPKSSQQIHILSPFDNLIIQRKRLEKLFNFNYQVECYAPEKKRKFGYFCLPVLEGETFVGRLDAKAHRKIKTLEIKKMFYEDSAEAKTVKKHLTGKLQSFGQFNQCPSVVWSPINPRD